MFSAWSGCARNPHTSNTKHEKAGSKAITSQLSILLLLFSQMKNYVQSIAKYLKQYITQHNAIPKAIHSAIREANT